ncbi:CoA-binding protein, partial [Candidatus Gribaldobacteria bacterium]|nr:CoA-binding protein [Candidatus Gribaldobacteria bacterium]
MINKFIKPKTIALVGATNRQGSVGLALTRNLLKSQAKIIFINPKKKMLFKNKVFPSLLEVKDEIDLVVIAVKAEIVPKIAKECALKKVKAVIILSAGFSEINTRGKDLERETAQILTQASIPFLGPNCFGIIKPSNHLNTSFSSQNPKKGNLAFLSQSGALMNVLIEKSLLAQSGFSLMVSLGNLAGFGFEDWFEYLKNDKETKAIALYVENVKNGEAFIRKAQELSSLKPIIALKGGKTEQGKKASQSHTGALSSHSEIYSAAFRK